MKRKNLVKLVSAYMSCLILTTPLYSSASAVEPNSKKGDIKNTVLKVGGAIAGVVGITTLVGVLYNKLSNNNNNSESNNTNTNACKPNSNSNTTLSTFEENFLEFKGTNKPDGDFFNNPKNYTHILMSKINSLKKHVMVVEKSVVDENFLRDIGSNGDTVVVNAANRWGTGGGGVCGVIFKAMGLDWTVTEVENWKRRTGKDEIGTGNVFIHPSYELGKNVKSVKYVMQTVGPDFRECNVHEGYEKLYEAYYNTIILAAFKGVKNVVMPAISMGIFLGNASGEECSIIALTAIADALETLEQEHLQTNFMVYLCDFKSDTETSNFFKKCEILLKS